jgi:uncharacterized protein YgbK (DUF1537 family)
MIFIIADDLTGACDTGACFAQHGLSTAVQIRIPAKSMPQVAVQDVLVFNTASRALSEPLAISAVQSVAQQIPLVEPLIYKKIDSTLRGHPGAELRALMEALQIDRALVTPAFPAQGRTVIDGQLLVQGQPISQTVFALEGALGDLRSSFAYMHLPIHSLGLDDVRHGSPDTRTLLREPGITLADAQTEADLRLLARLACDCGIRLFCGSAGLAMALAEETAPANKSPASIAHTEGATLGVAGSLNPATAQQVRYANLHGITILQPPPDWAQGSDSCPPVTLIDTLCSALVREGRAIFSTSGLPESPSGRETVARKLGALVAQVAARITLQGLVLTGGDVAMAVCTALGTQWLSLYGEAQPGIALGQLADGPYAGVGIITKAGGFGAEDALSRSMEQLDPRSTHISPGNSLRMTRTR